MPSTLILGASGFLGREVVPAFHDLGPVTAVAHRPRPGFLAVDLRDPKVIERVCRDVAPDLVILLAAYREPDFCEEHPDEARRLNVDPARTLARILPESTRLLYTSTDYVFDGLQPPYTETSPTNPISVYGRTKLDGELALAGRPNTAILRVPLLIGGGTTLKETGFIGQMVDAIRSRAEQLADDVLIRFPTWTRDVAGALRFLATRPLNGIYHLSGPRGGTRHQWTAETASILGLPCDHIRRSTTVVPRRARRPDNSQLADDKLKASGYIPRTDFRDVVHTVLTELGELA